MAMAPCAARCIPSLPLPQQLVGFIGVGNMGSPMASNLLRAGYSLLVFDRSKPALDRLVSQGARAAACPQEIAETKGGS